MAAEKELNAWDKLLNFITGSAAEDDDDYDGDYDGEYAEDYSYEEEQEQPEEPAPARRRMRTAHITDRENNLVIHYPSEEMKVVIVRPRKVDEAMNIAEHIKERRTVPGPSQ